MRNWKTSLFGAIFAVGQYFGATKTGQIVSIVGALGLGFVSKDSNVTGGTVQQ